MQHIHPDPCPTLIVERGPHDEGVGSWVPEQKHRLVQEYLTASRHAWKKWANRILIDPFAGPGRIQVKGEPFTRDGGDCSCLPCSARYGALHEHASRRHREHTR